MPEAIPLTVESPDISLNDFRALREGRDVKATSSEAPPAAKPADAESVGVPDTPEVNEDGTETTPVVAKPPAKRGMVDEITKLRIQNRELQARLKEPTPTLPADAPPAAAAAPAAVPADDKEPDVNNFEDYPKWLKEWNRWDRRQEQKAAAVEAAKVQTQTVQQAKAQTWNAQVEAAKVARPDFEAVALNKDVPVTPTMATALTDSELGSEILYHLGSNPAEAARIAKLSQVAQIREIGKIEALLTPAASETDSEESGTPPLKTVPISKAPAPVSRPSGGAVGKPNPVKLLNTMTQAEYRSYRESGKL